MPLTSEMKELLKQKGISAVSDPPGKIRVYVETIEDVEKLPPFIAGYSVEPIVSGRFFALQDRKAKWRPAPGGVSIGHPLITAGTLGSRVFDKTTKIRLILSNNHVLAASNQGRVGDSILQPGKYDGGTEADTIGRLERFVSLLPPPAENLVDCAVARALSDADLADEILDIGVVTGMEDAVVGMTCAKSGRTTAYNESVIQDVNATVKVYGYPWDYTIFKDQIITGFMASGGDSGSLLVNKNTKNAVGLLFAGSSTLTIHNKITNVANLLNLDFRVAPPPPPPPVLMGIPTILGTIMLGFMGLGLVMEEKHGR